MVLKGGGGFNFNGKKCSKKKIIMVKMMKGLAFGHQQFLLLGQSKRTIGVFNAIRVSHCTKKLCKLWLDVPPAGMSASQTKILGIFWQAGWGQTPMTKNFK